MGLTLVAAAKAGTVTKWFGDSIVITLSVAGAATLLVGTAEGIKLAFDIQSNTLATARNTADRSPQP
jgi:hypothetical protein